MTLCIGWLAAACGSRPVVPTHDELAAGASGNTSTAMFGGQACIDCHADRLEGVQPDHSTFPDDCGSCHGTEAWTPAMSGVNHDEWWPLTGAHADADCASCHIDGVYEGTPRDCEGCHMPDYDATTDPDHVEQGFPEACVSCHTTVAWQPADFGNHDDWWPLTGVHEDASCASCHVNEVYEGTPRECKGCHFDDYETAAVLDHKAAPLSLECTGCHTTSAWQPADFPIHNQYFPITNGNHSGLSCTSCHLNSETSWSSFTCIDCHLGEHPLDEMNNEHRGDVDGYDARLQASETISHGCLHCHPDGEED